jgi:hypothetical protein
MINLLIGILSSFCLVRLTYAVNCFPPAVKQWDAVTVYNYIDLGKESITVSTSNIFISGYVSDFGNMTSGICNEQPNFSVFLTIQKSTGGYVSLGTRLDTATGKTYIDIVRSDDAGVKSPQPGTNEVINRSFFFSVRR